MKKALNIVAPIVIAAYTITFLTTYGQSGPGPYLSVTCGLVVCACVFWFAYGIADFDS